MKKYFSILLMALCCMFMACSKDAKEKVLAYDLLPEPAKQLISMYFNPENVILVTLEEGEYEVKFNDGCSLEFSKSGELRNVDCQTNEVPSGLIPLPVQQYVSENFPNAFITEWGKEGKKYYKAELNTGIELIFNKSYEFVRLDD